MCFSVAPVQKKERILLSLAALNMMADIFSRDPFKSNQIACF